MSTSIRAAIISLSCIVAVGCGVKGKPLPPLKPPFIGNGEHPASSAVEKSDEALQDTKNK